MISDKSKKAIDFLFGRIRDFAKSLESLQEGDFSACGPLNISMTFSLGHEEFAHLVTLCEPRLVTREYQITKVGNIVKVDEKEHIDFTYIGVPGGCYQPLSFSVRVHRAGYSGRSTEDTTDRAIKALLGESKGAG
jgi:hypothetical protein